MSLPRARTSALLRAILREDPLALSRRKCSCSTMANSKPLTYIVAGVTFLSMGATKCGSMGPEPDPEPGAQGTGTGAETNLGTTSSLPGGGTSTPTKKPDLSTSGSEGTGEACAPPSKWFVSAGCPITTSRGFGDFPSDCYLSCAADPNLCPEGTLCRNVQYDPCLPQFEPGQTFGTKCDTCTLGGKLCLPLAKGPDCADFAGTYQTTEEKECGKTATGVNLCKWRLSFLADGTFSWRFSDISQTGNYFCHGSTVYLDVSLPIGGTGPSQSYKVTFDPVTRSMMWEGETYHRVP